MAIIRTADIAPDGGWGWLVVFGAGCNFGLIFGLFKASGILSLEVLELLPGPRTLTTVIPPLAIGISCGMGPIAAKLGMHYSNRLVVFLGAFLSFLGMALTSIASSLTTALISYGIILGIGMGLVIVPSVVMISMYFDTRRARAMSLSMLGGSIGAILVPLLFQYLVSTYGSTGGVLIMAGVISNMCICAMLFRPLSMNYAEPSEKEVLNSKNTQSQEEKMDSYEAISDASKQDDTNSQVIIEEPSKSEKSNGQCFRFCQWLQLDCSLLKEPSFLLITLTFCSYSFTNSVIWIVLPGHVTDPPDPLVTRVQSAMLVSMTAAGDMAGRLVLGWISDKGWLLPASEAFISLCGLGITVLLFPLIKALAGLISMCIIFGVLSGSCLVLPFILLRVLLKESQYPMAVGLMETVFAVPALISGPIVGELRTVTGRYEESFFLMGSMLVLTSTFWLKELFKQKKFRSK